MPTKHDPVLTRPDYGRVIEQGFFAQNSTSATNRYADGTQLLYYKK